MDNDQPNPVIGNEEDQNELEDNLTVPAGDVVEPSEALAETVVGHEADPADVVAGDDEIGEHIAEAEETTPA